MSHSRYEKIRPIQRGGMAELFEAVSHGSGQFSRRVALKQLLPEHASDPEMVDAFKDEARILSSLHHANIVSVLDFGELEGVPFQALELVDGLDLGVFVERLESRGSKLPEASALFIVTEVARALEHAHAAKGPNGRPLGVVHRDVSPDNILISFAGDVKLADFGIALAVERQAQTQIGVTKGKLEWMSPEQHRGDVVDAKSDAFSLGLVLLRLLTGQNRMELDRERRSIAAGRPVSLAGTVAADIGTVLQKALAPEPSLRSSVTELRRGLLKALASREDFDPRNTLVDLMAGLRQGSTPKARSPLSALFVVDEGFDASATDAMPSQILPVIEPATLHGAMPVEPSTVHGRLPSIDSERSGKNHPVVRHRITIDNVTIEKVSAKDAPERRPRSHEPSEDRTDPDSDEADGPPTHISRGDSTLAEDASDSSLSVGAYRIEASIGRGGMAEVFRAVEKSTGKTFALKILRTPIENRRARERFKREIQALRDLDHDGIVRVFDHGTTRDDRPYMVMELLRGIDMRNLVDQAGALQTGRAAGIVRSVLSTLSVIHGAGYVHRDLSPANVMLLEDGRVKILDFGIVRPADLEMTRLTRSGDLIGTLRFMAPEQLASAPEVGPPADVYAAGLLLRWLLEGAGPFRGDPKLIAGRRMQEDPVVPEGPCRPLLLRMLARDPAQRPSADEARVELDRLVPTASIPTRFVPDRSVVAETPQPRSDRRPVIIAVVAASMGLVGGLVIERVRSSGAQETPVNVVVEAPVVPTAVTSTGAVPQEVAPPVKKVEPKQKVEEKPKSVETKPVMKEKKPVRSLEPELAARLRPLGVTLVDLLAVPSTRGLAGELRDAARADDLERLNGVLSKLEAGSFDHVRFAEERMSGLRARIESFASSAPPEKVDQAERRFLDLRTKISGKMGSGGLAALLEEIRSLEAELR